MGREAALECKKGGSERQPPFAPIYLQSQITVSNLSDDEEEVFVAQSPLTRPQCNAEQHETPTLWLAPSLSMPPSTTPLYPSMPPSMHHDHPPYLKALWQAVSCCVWP